MCYHFESMKSKLLFIPIAAIAISMASCDFTDDSWREKYGTPELFLSQADGEYHQETLLLGEETYDVDFNYEISTCFFNFNASLLANYGKFLKFIILFIKSSTVFRSII